MAKDNKIEVITKNGTHIRMNEAALKIAEKYFGVSRSLPGIKEKPVELLKLPSKIEVIKAAPVEIKAEAPEAIPVEIKAETPEVISPKRTSRKR